VKRPSIKREQVKRESDHVNPSSAGHPCPSIVIQIACSDIACPASLQSPAESDLWTTVRTTISPGDRTTAQTGCQSARACGTLRPFSSGLSPTPQRVSGPDGLRRALAPTAPPPGTPCLESLA